jgi:exodeoxyribonuclease VII small subunit
MTTKKVDYRQLNDELDGILARLQSGELNIDEAVPAYERGIQLVKELEAYLQTAENKITELQAKLQD